MSWQHIRTPTEIGLPLPPVSVTLPIRGGYPDDVTVYLVEEDFGRNGRAYLEAP